MNDSRSTLLEAVQLLDPERSRPPALVDADALLARIRGLVAAEPEPAAPDAATPSHQPRSKRGYAVGAAALTLAVAAAITVANLGTPTAYASWTPTPTELADAATVAQSCPQTIVAQGPASDPTDFTEVPLSPVLAEQRGDYTFVVSIGDQGYSECLVSESAEGPVATANSLLAPDRLPLVPTATDGLTVLDAGDSSWGDDASEGDITSMVGTAGADVRAIEVTTTDGTRAKASLADGWWALWFPGSVDIGATITVTTADGATHQVEVAAAALLPGSS